MTNPHPHISDPIPVAVPELSTTAAITPPLAVAHPESLLIEEIRILRERGLTDECIHGLFSGFNIDARPNPPACNGTFPPTISSFASSGAKPSPPPSTNHPAWQSHPLRAHPTDPRDGSDRKTRHS